MTDGIPRLTLKLPRLSGLVTKVPTPGEKWTERANANALANLDAVVEAFQRFETP
jgi:hypothetical protein